MNNRIKIVLLWIIIAISIVIHSTLEMSVAFYFEPLPKEPMADSIPPVFHIISILAMVLPLIFSVLTIFFETKVFRIITLVYAILISLLNIFHVVEEFSFKNPTQLLLLTFLAVTSVFLTLTANTWRKEVH